MPSIGQSNSGGLKTRGNSALFGDPQDGMPAAGGKTRLEPIIMEGRVVEDNEMRERSKKKKKKSRTSGDPDTDRSDHANISDNTDLWDVLLGLFRLLDNYCEAVRQFVEC